MKAVNSLFVSSGQIFPPNTHFDTNFMKERYIYKSSLNIRISDKGLCTCIYYTYWNVAINKSLLSNEI